MQNEVPQQPAAAYWERLQVRAAEASRSQRSHFVIGYLRVALALVFVAFLWLAFIQRSVSWIWAVVPLVLLIAAGVVHSRVLRARAKARRAVAFYELGLAHIEEQWAGLKPRKTRLDISASLYAKELDLFDPDGLFELLCTARTQMGEDRLADWLLNPAAIEEIQERHNAIEDLRPRFDLREDMAVVGRDLRIAIDPSALLAWAEEKAPGLPNWLRWTAPLLLVLTVAAAVLSIRLDNAAPIIALAVVDAVVTYGFVKRTNDILKGAKRASESLQLFSALVSRLEHEPFTAPRLQMLQARFQTGGKTASGAIGSLARLAELADYRLNYIVKALDAPLLYSVQLAGRVEVWRRNYGPACRGWLNALGQFEALQSLATYSYEHPDDPFPEMAEGEPVFEAEALGHPLMPVAECVRNDVQLNSRTQLVVVTGSNMSGKSTLLRAVGLNAVLAMTGAPVRAKRLRLTPMRLGADIGINDSFVEGRSRFYAEILRLGTICELAEANGPVLFLLDELLAGTNSVDRLAGARGIARALLRSGAIGMISTHDLALGEVGEREGWPVGQQHFDEEVVENMMRFDYLLKPGPVTTRNGVELMRLIGIKV